MSEPVFLILAVFVLILTIATIMLPLFVWGIYNQSCDTAKTLKRIEVALQRDARNADMVLRNIDGNLAMASTEIGEMAERGRSSMAA